MSSPSWFLVYQSSISRSLPLFSFFVCSWNLLLAGEDGGAEGLFHQHCFLFSPVFSPVVLFFGSVSFVCILWSLLLFLFPLFSVPKYPLSSSVSWLPPMPVHSPAFPSSVFISSPSFFSVSVSFSSCFFLLFLTAVQSSPLFLFEETRALSRPPSSPFSLLFPSFISHLPFYSS
jgi:hypothetical protein